MRPLRLLVRAGDVGRVSPLVRVRIPFSSLKTTDQRSLTPGGTTPVLRDEQTGCSVPAQYDPVSGELSFVIDGEIGSGESRSFREVTEHGDNVDTSDDAPFPASFTVKLDRVALHVAGEEFATYNFSGTQRPYFWPVLGPSGASVVRGRGSREHPHHTGLVLNYGGHGEGGSTNIWSDWDEPPYGPGGRMLHRGFRRLLSGPVYGELAQDLTYVNSDGDPFAEEIRTVRWWWANKGLRFLDMEFCVQRVQDRGPGPFLLMIRTPPCFGIPKHGRVTNSAGRPVPERFHTKDYYYRAAWVDAAGPTGGPPPAPPAGPPEELPDLQGAFEEYEALGTGPWNGIALFDHPTNDGYPNVVGKYAVSRQITQAHYPPASAPEGPFSFRHRVLVHDGDADDIDINTLAADYASPCDVEIDRSSGGWPSQ